MNWIINETKKTIKDLKKVPEYIREHYAYWKLVIVNHGPDWIKINIKGSHFEKLKGKRSGQYSCRLSKGYRVIFEINNNELIVLVVEVNKHEY